MKCSSDARPGCLGTVLKGRALSCLSGYIGWASRLLAGPSLGRERLMW